jgi:hypothetical protein
VIVSSAPDGVVDAFTVEPCFIATCRSGCKSPEPCPNTPNENLAIISLLYSILVV